MIHHQRLAAFGVVEPRITHIARELQRLLSLVELLQDGQPVQVNEFRLRDLRVWQDYATDHALNALLPISGVCNSRCQFCFEYGIPYARECSFMPLAEAEARLAHYDAATGRCLFPSHRPQLETFLHPQALEIIRRARARDPEAVFALTTNGSLLDEALLTELAVLGSLLIKLSLNVSDPALHRELMGLGARTEVALAAPQRLRAHGIPFIGSIVAWPTIPLEAIERTVRHLDDCEAYAIHLRLPLVHRWARQQPDVDWAAYWQEVAAFGRQLQPTCRSPLIVEPPLYAISPIVPLVDGVILHSPAYRAGLHAMDQVLRISGEEISTRTQSSLTLRQQHAQGKAVDMVVQRGGSELTFHLDAPSAADSHYPYDAAHAYRGQSYGVLHVTDLHLGHIQAVFDLIARYGAKEVLLFTSPVVAPIFDLLVNHIAAFQEQLREVNLYIATISDNTLGGDYDFVDSRFVADYRRVIREALAQGQALDLVLIPSAFGSDWGMDLSGASYAELAIEFGVPVELIDWYLVYGQDI